MIKTQLVTLVANTVPARFKIATKIEMPDGEVRLENRLDNLSIQQIDDKIAEYQAIIDDWTEIKQTAESLIVE